MNLRYGGYMTMLTGFLMLIGNACWGGIRNFNELDIPFEEARLMPTFGWCFWLNLIAGTQRFLQSQLSTPSVSHILS